MRERYVRFAIPEQDRIWWGTVDGDDVIAMTDAPYNQGSVTTDRWPRADVRILAPAIPSKIICIGLNYHAHVKASYSADEAPERPLIFLKPPSSIIGPGDEILHPTVSERVDYEAELGVIIGKRARNVAEKDAMTCVFGYTCVNDVTARDLQKADGQWSRAKGFDTFCPVGPEIITDFDPSDILVEGIHNGEVKQSGRTSQMIFKIPFLISYISSIMTLEPGDLISTGTPSGIAPMKPGDSIEVRIETVGSLVNSVAAPS